MRSVSIRSQYTSITYQIYQSILRCHFMERIKLKWYNRGLYKRVSPTGAEWCSNKSREDISSHDIRKGSKARGLPYITQQVTRCLFPPLLSVYASFLLYDKLVQPSPTNSVYVWNLYYNFLCIAIRKNENSTVWIPVLAKENLHFIARLIRVKSSLIQKGFSLNIRPFTN